MDISMACKMSNDQILRILRLLRRLDELRKSGVLTQQEYEERVALLKKQLQALSSKRRCPRCGSGNIIGFKGGWECFDCGYKFGVESFERQTSIQRTRATTPERRRPFASHVLSRKRPSRNIKAKALPVIMLIVGIIIGFIFGLPFGYMSAQMSLTTKTTPTHQAITVTKTSNQHQTPIGEGRYLYTCSIFKPELKWGIVKSFSQEIPGGLLTVDVYGYYLEMPEQFRNFYSIIHPNLMQDQEVVVAGKDGELKLNLNMRLDGPPELVMSLHKIVMKAYSDDITFYSKDFENFTLRGGDTHIEEVILSIPDEWSKRTRPNYIGIRANIRIHGISQFGEAIYPESSKGVLLDRGLTIIDAGTGKSIKFEADLQNVPIKIDLDYINGYTVGQTGVVVIAIPPDDGEKISKANNLTFTITAKEKVIDLELVRGPAKDYGHVKRVFRVSSMTEGQKEILTTNFKQMAGGLWYPSSDPDKAAALIKEFPIPGAIGLKLYDWRYKPMIFYVKYTDPSDGKIYRSYPVFLICEIKET